MLIILIIFIVAIIATVAIAATVYVYVSGMSSGPSFSSTPSVYFTAVPGEGDSSNDAIIMISHITDEYVSWYEVSYSITDLTDSDILEEGLHYTTDTEYGLINDGDQIEITGLGLELEEDHEYRLVMIYDTTGKMMGTVTWTQ